MLRPSAESMQGARRRSGRAALCAFGALLGLSGCAAPSLSWPPELSQSTEAASVGSMAFVKDTFLIAGHQGRYAWTTRSQSTPLPAFTRLEPVEFFGLQIGLVQQVVSGAMLERINFFADFSLQGPEFSDGAQGRCEGLERLIDPRAEQDAFQPLQLRCQVRDERDQLLADFQMEVSPPTPASPAWRQEGWIRSPDGATLSFRTEARGRDRSVSLAPVYVLTNEQGQAVAALSSQGQALVAHLPRMAPGPTRRLSMLACVALSLAQRGGLASL